MGNTTWIIVLAVVIAFAFAYFNYVHKRQFRYNPEELKKTVDTIFSKKTDNAIDRIDFLKALRMSFNCSRKDAAYLLGQALRSGFLNINGEQVVKVG